VSACRAVVPPGRDEGGNVEERFHGNSARASTGVLIDTMRCGLESIAIEDDPDPFYQPDLQCACIRPDW